jgi:hypothetical protein
MGKMKITEVEEVNYGTYVWQMPDGKLVMDEDHNYMCIYSIKGDASKISELRKFAKSHGIDEGKPLWFSGHRPVTDDQYEYQKQRMDLGLVADDWDIPALKEDMEQKRKMGIL